MKYLIQQGRWADWRPGNSRRAV